MYRILDWLFDDGGFLLIVSGLLLYFLSAIFGGLASDREYLKYDSQIAADKWKAQGFQITDYEGWSFGMSWLPGYGGKKVWHRLEKIPDNGITYSGYLVQWGNELHVYGPKAIDAIKP